MFVSRIRARLIAAFVCVAVVAACSATFRKHGYTPSDEQLSALVVGVDTRSTVDDVIGAPSASGMLSDGDYYYVSSRFRHYGAFAPEVVERQVVAISFDDADTIANIERFGLEEGRVVPLTRRVTDSSVVGRGFLRQLFKNLGNFNPGELFD
ncbi:outer membrane protein assembly factor BamE [Roseovarius sp. SYSU LYC5161]|uniref:outer membrane protein assembly factor BamE n=1 Tax=Roseovarius halophilus (ex Wu et al. 2025) TaxID=3376060 RepID=UPI002871F578|nr:outer membrane protein assembly factor BamE [Roseovarius sp.]